MDFVTIAAERERPSASSSCWVTHSAPAAFMKQLGKRTPAMVVDRSSMRASYITPDSPLTRTPRAGLTAPQRILTTTDLGSSNPRRECGGSGLPHLQADAVRRVPVGSSSCQRVVDCEDV